MEGGGWYYHPQERAEGMVYFTYISLKRIMVNVGTYSSHMENVGLDTPPEIEGIDS